MAPSPTREPMSRASDTLVYVGTIDDQVLEHPWPGIPLGENFLIETIVDHVLFGMPMLINDGYLVNHPLARADLLKGDASLILALVKKGFIKVLTRVQDLDALHRMPLEMARQGIGTFGQRLASGEWERLQYVLGALGASLRPHFNCYFWPPVDMGDGFRLLLDNARTSIAQKGYASLGFASRDADFVRRHLDKVGDRLARDTAGARNAYTMLLHDALKDAPTDTAHTLRSDLMGLANEIYHFNFGIQMDRKLRGDGLSVITETRLSQAFDDLLAVEERVISIDAPLPLMGRPDFVTTLDPGTLAAIVDAGTPIGAAKQTFQHFMREFARGRNTPEEARDFARQYEKALIRHFTARTTPRGLKLAIQATMIISPALVGLGIPAGAAAASTADLASGAAQEVTMGGLSSFVGEPWLMRVAQRYRRRRMARTFEGSRSELKPSIQRAMLSTIRFNREVTDPIGAAIRTF